MSIAAFRPDVVEGPALEACASVEADRRKAAMQTVGS